MSARTPGSRAGPAPEEMALMDAIADMAVDLMWRGRDGDMAVESKSDPADLVTWIDREIESRARAMVAAAYPEHGFIGEEDGGRADAAGTTWLVDPLDGTANYANGIPHACVSIGLYRGGRAVAGLIADPFRRERFRSAPAGAGGDVPLAAKAGSGLAGGIVLLELGSHRLTVLAMLSARVSAAGGVCRVLGSVGLSLAYVAAGRADAAVVRGAPWDLAGGAALAGVAGVRVAAWDGRPPDILAGGTMLASKPGTFDLLAAWLRDAPSGPDAPPSPRT